MIDLMNYFKMINFWEITTNVIRNVVTLAVTVY